MASFLQVARQGCRLLGSNSLRTTRFIQPACGITTSKKNKDTITAAESPLAPTQEKLLEKEENWISFGYSYTDRDFDEFSHKSVLFMTVSVLFGLGGLYLAYYPDFKMRDWAQREAYMQLALREKEGMPLIDPNLIPADSVQLPSDEELGSTEIII